MVLERGFVAKESKERGTNRARSLMALPNPGEAPGARAFDHNYAQEGYQLKSTTGLDGSSSAAGGAGQIRGRPEQERPPDGASSGGSVQEREHDREQEAVHEVRKEWKQKMETEEGSRKLWRMVKAKVSSCPVYKERHF